jgi:YaiO family outer membrane protein
VNSATGIVEKYVGSYRVAYAIGVSSLPGSSKLLNHGLTVNWYHNDRASLGVTINSGKEAEAIGPDQVLETTVRGVSLGGRRQLTDRLGLQWWLGLHDQGDYYRREYLGLAVSIKL